MAAPYAWWWQAWEIASLVRASLELGELGLAESMVGGFHARNPYAHHAAVASNAAILEARGDLAAAIAAYGDAADRWASFEVVPELAFALLGQGRSLVAGGRARRGCRAPRAGAEHLRRTQGRTGPRRDCRAVKRRRGDRNVIESGIA